MTRALLRWAVILSRAIGIAVVLAIVIAVVFVFIPAERDMEIRNQITARVQVGQAVSDVLIRHRRQTGVWPEDSEHYSRDGIEVLRDGLVRVHLTGADAIAGKWVDLRVSIENGHFYRWCTAPDIKSGRLPARCREGAIRERIRAN